MKFTVRLYEDIEVEADSKEEAIERLLFAFEGENEHEKAAMKMIVLHK